MIKPLQDYLIKNIKCPECPECLAWIKIENSILLCDPIANYEIEFPIIINIHICDDTAELLVWHKLYMGDYIKHTSIQYPISDPKFPDNLIEKTSIIISNAITHDK